MRIFTTSDLGVRIARRYRTRLNTQTRWIYDRLAVLSQVSKWSNEVPWIKPFYAVKSNPLPYLIADITRDAAFPIGLDVASMKEVRLARQFTDFANTIYTNPHSIPHESSEWSFNLKVVDSMCEVELLHANRVKCPIIVRVNSACSKASIDFDSKFGASLDEAHQILQTAQRLDYSVQGVSFHIGSGGEFSRVDAFQSAYEANALPILQRIRQAFDQTRPILNVGGGFLPDTDLADALGWTRTLPYRLIAEPGRFFSAPSHHLAMQVIATTSRGLFLDNGVYHELNGFHRDHWTMPMLTRVVDNSQCADVVEYVEASVFGPTCDSYDTLGKCVLPRGMQVGDWILLPNMGAYTNAGMVEFNGILGASSSP